MMTEHRRKQDKQRTPAAAVVHAQRESVHGSRHGECRSQYYASMAALHCSEVRGSHADIGPMACCYCKCALWCCGACCYSICMCVSCG